ncbi:MAG: TetR/AcrR family transcriptional regulator [Burkholderiales bacterium]
MKKIEQRQASIERLLDAALHQFVSMGYRSTNLEQIAGAAGLTKGAVYFYFGSKEAVLIALLKRVQTVVFDKAIKAVEQAGPTLTGKLVAFLHNAAKLGITHRDEVLLLILMSLEFKERKGKVLVCIDGIYERTHALIQRLILAGQKSGEFRSDVPTRELATIVMANHDGTFLEWYRRSDVLNGRDLVRALRSVVISGLRRTETVAPAQRRRKAAGGASRGRRVRAHNSA